MENNKEQNNKPLVLAVDDDRTALMLLESGLNKNGYKVLLANDAKSAIEIIKKEYTKLDAILLDRIMPDMDGLEIVKLMRSNPEISKIPVIMQTGSDSPEQIKEGIDAGVFYYLTKPIEKDVLRSVVASAVKESTQRKILHNELQKHKLSFKLMEACKFYVKTLDEAEQVACFIANSFPDPEKILPGIAELIINAIEHGKCNITYEDKTKLVAEAAWRDEVTKRCSSPELKDKFIEVIYFRKDGKHSIKVSDNGPGFAWHKFLKVDPARSMDNHGRGVARANMLFDKLEFNKEGNIVQGTVDPSVRETIEW